MSEFLLFTLYAPLASWGEIAVGETRSSWDRPSRSAILGLIACALGVTRDDAEGHDALRDGYGTAVRLDAEGMTLVDYHTAQTASSSIVKRERPTTRRALLDRPSAALETILSRRQYRVDALATIAVWKRDDARWPLAALADALRRPTFVLFAGRKANVFGHPLDPAIVESATLAGAFAARPPGSRVLDLRRVVGANTRVPEISHDVIRPEDGFVSGLRNLRTDTRRDVPMHRGRWQFAERAVQVGVDDGRDIHATPEGAL